MATLNLTANNSREQIVLDNLIPTVSDTLAEKINNGVYIEKDGKRLLNKKDLTTFMSYATEQARKIYNEQKSGSQAVCVLGDDIIRWAIHYFEEDSIEGKLYNEDGTEYKPPKPVKTTTKNTTPSIPHSPPTPKPKPQLSMFDLLDEKATDQSKECAGADNVASTETPASIPPENDPSVEEIADALQQAVDAKNAKQSQTTVSPLYSRYIAVQEQYPEHIALMRLGDFYEAFDNDAETLSDELNLTLTGKDVGLDSRVPMVGFPYHASDTYIAKIRERHSVVVIEDGNVVTLSRTVKDNGMTVDTVTGEVLREEADEPEELTESEMRQFDGDIQEPKSLDEGELTETAEQSATISPSSFDEDTAIYLLKLFDGKMDIA